MAASGARPAADPGDGVADALQAAIGLLRDEDIEAAERAFDALLARAPGLPPALHFQGILRHVQGRSAEGIALMRRSIEAEPAEAGFRNNLGNVLVECGQLDEACEAYKTAVRLGREDPSGAGTGAAAQALSNLAVVHRKREQWAEAAARAREALALWPEFVDAWFNLSVALLHLGEHREALLANSKAIALAPHHLQARDQVIRALLLLGEHGQAVQLYREWLAEEPDNPVVQHQLAACLGEAAPERASDAYVELLFDSFADSFDAKLDSLKYRAPALVAEALRQVAGAPRAALDLCDAGCGTGLCGPLVRPWARHLAGCDLSVGMLRKARPRGAYDVLHKAELVYYLDTQPSRFDVVLSADTLCYFGTLEAAMAAAHKALRPGGWLIYTVEGLEDGHAGQHVLQPNGRYAHRRDYLEATARAAGFRSFRCEPVELRLEAARPVPGWLVSAGRD